MAASKNAEREAREARERLRRYNARQTVHAHQVTRRKRDNVVAVVGVLVVAALATVTQLFYFNGGPGTPTPAPSSSATAEAQTPQTNIGAVPDPSVAEARTWTGQLDINGIPLAISLDGALAPQAVASFVTSVQDGYYPGKTCHRMVLTDSARLLQCGSLDGTGATDPSYSFGPLENTPVDGIYPTGTIAMARAGGDAYSSSRQFFIIFSDTQLPDDAAGGYTVVGQVTDGLDELIAQVADGGITGDAADGAPVVPTTITGLTIQ